MLSGVALVCSCLFPAPLLYAQSDLNADFPVLSGRVVDAAAILDPAIEAELSNRLATHETDTGNQLVVVTLADLGGYDIAEYANRLGRHWAIGTAAENNGVIFLIAPNDRKVRIEVGYGLEGELTDALSSIIIQREVLPAFRQGDYSVGVVQGVTAILDAIKGEYVAVSERRNVDDEYNDTMGSFVPLIFVGLIGLNELLRRTGNRKVANSAFPAGFAGLMAALASGQLWIGIVAAVVMFLFVYLIGSGNSGGGNSRSAGTRGYTGTGGFGRGGSLGGGGFSGGGGSFGGGGASGSW